MTVDAPLQINSRAVTADNGARVLIVCFVGEYGVGCQGNGDASDMRRATERALREHLDAEAVVLDATKLDYVWGDAIGNAAPEGGVPWLWASSDSCPGLLTYVPEEMGRQANEWLFQPLERAVRVAAERCRATSFELHDEAGEVAERVELESRGRRFVAIEAGRPLSEKLWFARRPIERIVRDENGDIESVVHWPHPDAVGGRSDACRFQARVVYERDLLRTLDFSPYRDEFAELLEYFGETHDEARVHHHPLPANWLESLAECTDLQELRFDETSVTDADVTRALAARPELRKLNLSHTRVTKRVLDTLASAAALEHVWLFGVPVEASTLRAFAQSHPRLHVGYDGMYERA